MESGAQNSAEQKRDLNANDTTSSETNYPIESYLEAVSLSRLELVGSSVMRSELNGEMAEDGADQICKEVLALKIGNGDETGDGDAQHEEPTAPDDVPSRVNGLTFGKNNTYIPEELMQEVLSHVDVESIRDLRDVCCNWRRLVDEAYFWKQVMKRRGMLERWFPIFRHTQGRTDAWKVFHADVKNQFLDQNLIRNPSGEDGFASWTHMSGEVGGWTIDNLSTQDQPPGISKWPGAPNEGNVFCFGTNSFSCSKEQDVDLWQLGFTPAVMRACIPFAITWSEVVATPTGCAGLYEAQIMLLDSSLGPISPFSPYHYSVRQLIPGGSSWRPYQKRFLVDHTNEHEVCEELRYVHVFHGAMEHEFITQGHWGPRMACSSVTISLVNPDPEDGITN